MPLLDNDPLPLIPADTVMTDRQLLIHLLQHVEEMHEEQRQLAALVEEFGPVLERFRNRGRLPFGRNG